VLPEWLAPVPTHGLDDPVEDSPGPAQAGDEAASHRMAELSPP
jgi:hypothetical protein